LCSELCWIDKRDGIIFKFGHGILAKRTGQEGCEEEAKVVGAAAPLIQVGNF